MKTTLKILFSICLVLSLIGVVAGADVDQDTADPIEPGTSSGTMVVSYTIGTETFVIYIPGALNFADSKYSGKENITAEVIAKNVTLTSGHVLNLTVNSTHNWKMPLHDLNTETVKDINVVLPYTMWYTPFEGEETKAEGDGDILILSAPSGTGTIITQLKFKLDGTAPQTGFYKDTLTFKASIDPTQVTEELTT